MKRYKRKTQFEREQLEAWKIRVGFAKKTKDEFVPLTPKAMYRRDEGLNYPSGKDNLGIAIKEKPKYTGELLERELKAQEEIEKKKKRVAPLHKSNYIYIDDGINPAGLGRKNEVL